MAVRWSESYLAGPSAQVSEALPFRLARSLRAALAFFFPGFPAVLCAAALKPSSFYLWKAADDPRARAAAAPPPERATPAPSARPFLPEERVK